MKATGEQVDDRIVEVFWETAHERWRMMRFRDDKPNGNYKTVVENIIQSIIDGVEKEDVRNLPLLETKLYIPLSLRDLSRYVIEMRSSFLSPFHRTFLSFSVRVSISSHYIAVLLLSALPYLSSSSPVSQ